MHSVTWHEYIYDASVATCQQSFDVLSIRGMPTQNRQNPSTTITCHGFNKGVEHFSHNSLLTLLLFELKAKIPPIFDVWLTVHRNSVWIRKTNQMSVK